jgi:D-lactate dehydrogenase (cytochrome)
MHHAQSKASHPHISEPDLSGRQAASKVPVAPSTLRALVALTGLRTELLGLIPDEARVSDSDSVLDQHAADLTYHEPHRPDVVVFPASVAEVSSVLAYANRARVPVVPFGAGTSLEGHVIPLHGGISLDMTRMDRILAVRPGDLTATVQAGVLRSKLDAAAGPHGLFFPVDPGADATIGGMAATNASGTMTIRYGGMSAHVLELEVVVPGGAVLRAGSRAVKSSAGYHLAALFVGSEGTLGVITELTLRLQPIPESIVAVRCAFPSVQAACRAAAAIVASGVCVQRCELVDSQAILATNAYKRSALPVSDYLFLEVAGSPAAVIADLDSVRELVEEEGAAGFEAESDPTARARLWEARHSALHARLATIPGGRALSTDVAVPVSELAEAIVHAQSALKESGLYGVVIGHAGDGNFHVGLVLAPDDPTAVERAKELNGRLIDDALARGGTSTGEHGIGVGKIDYLAQEHGDLLPVMRRIKDVFDPNWIMNPGTVLA